MKKMWCFFAGALLLALSSGCISYEYKGKAEEIPTPEETEVRVFENSARIQRTYSVLGEATVSADYDNVTRDRMVNKLVSKARECGADAVLLVDQQVVPSTQKAPHTSAYTVSLDDNDDSRSWNQIYRDVDQNYVNTRRNKKADFVEGDTVNYRRVIRAEYLKYDK